ncbi:MAG: undecaprenyl-phosphate glucose phosphotransferase [Deltaproteobacteria bacterium]|nr:undecaprenyl-phosphate glucose phosphotransferase [Deltaproteobacteria bacterium]
MLKRYNQVFISCLIILDAVITAVSWLLSYFLRFHVDIIPVTKGIPPFSLYLELVIYAVVIWGIVFRVMGLYAPMRSTSKLRETSKIAQASTVALLIFIALVYFIKEYKFSRLVILYFLLINIALLSSFRVLLRCVLHFIRRRGYNQRHVLIVGAGDLGQRVLKTIKQTPELGLKVVGFMDQRPDLVGRNLEGIQVLGPIQDIGSTLADGGIDQVVIALPLEDHEVFKEVMRQIDNEMVDIKVVPDLLQFMTLRGGVEELDGLSIISLRDSPLYGWNKILKRMMDIVFATVGIVVLFPLFILIALAIKLTSPGPLLFRQGRMGMDGRVFNILKFRTMRVDAEKETGAVWATRDDPRRTPVGAILRRMSLDELPQLINVLKGEMSLVGPRPERPELIMKFKQTIPKYMLRHKTKAGITGWAQIHGYRGNTSLEKRIECDLFYIQNWSLSLDLKIIMMTFWSGLINKNAY